MTNEISQPFAGDKQRSPDDSTLVEQVLGTEQADEMRELTDDQLPESSEQAEPFGDIKLSGAEQVAAEKAESDPRMMKRGRLIEWAEGFSKDSAWVDRTFEIDVDGAVAAKFDLDLSYTQAPHMNVLRGAVVRGNLWLLSCLVVSFPRDLTVNGHIYVKPHQHHLMRDMDRKGIQYSAIEE